MVKPRIQNNVLTASEIGQYVYCSVSWYLQKCGYKPESIKLDVGLKKHKKMGNFLKYTEVNKRRLNILKIVGYFCFVVSLLFFLLGVLI